MQICTAQRRFAVVVPSIVCAGLLVLCSLGAAGIEGSETSRLLFPPKPGGLTNCPTIGQPEIQLTSTQAEKLGGQDTTNLLVAQIAQLLSQSERFKLTHDKKARCRCVVRLSDLAIEPAKGTTKVNPGQLGKALEGFLKKNSKIPSTVADISTNINWSNDIQKLSIRCAVLVEIIDAEDGGVLAQDIGEETCTNTAKAMSLNLLGLDCGTGNTDNPHTGATASPACTGVNYQVRLVKLAAYRALCNLIPSLDSKLLSLPAAPSSGPALAPGKEISEDRDSASRLFCPNCGKSSGTGDRFCTHCGERVRR
jgi:hypothetical protein